MQTIQLLNASMMKFGPDPQVRELLQHQRQAIESMTRLLNALLDISRLEAGAIEPVNVEVSVADIFEELRSEFCSVARAREIEDSGIGIPADKLERIFVSTIKSTRTAASAWARAWGSRSSRKWRACSDLRSGSIPPWCPPAC